MNPDLENLSLLPFLVQMQKDSMTLATALIAHTLNYSARIDNVEERFTERPYLTIMHTCHIRLP